MKYKRCMKVCTLATFGLLLIHIGNFRFGFIPKSDVIVSQTHHADEKIRLSHETIAKGNASRSSAVTITAESVQSIISEECRAVLNGDIERIGELRNSSNDFPWRDDTKDTEVIKMASNCSNLYHRYNFIQLLQDSFPVSKEESEFPIAYSILAHENVNQILVLLSAIYRKHNIHCIHLDAKANAETKQALSQAVRCFPNIFISKNSERVIYAHVSRLRADIACMRDLLAIPKTKYNWKYLINLCSQDFPLWTNKEIVDQLKLFRGFNSIGGYSEISNIIRKRTGFVHRIENVTKNGLTQKTVVMTSQEHPPPPFNMTIGKNLAYNLYARDFLQWALVDGQVGLALLNWSNDTFSPDEHYWLMLHIYPGAPGGSSLTSGYQLARTIRWGYGKNIQQPCHGEWRHYNCVFGAEDIHDIAGIRELFVNKLDVTLDSTGPTCLRQMLDERTLTSNHLRSTTNPDRKASSPPDSFFL